MNKFVKNFQNIITNVSQQPLIILSIQILWGCIITLACVLRDWWVIILAAIFNYSLQKKWFSDNIQKALIIAIPFLYLLYIWTPLTDGTVGQMIINMRKE